MIIMMAVNGENIWTEEEGADTDPEDVLSILKDDGLDDDSAYKLIGRALVETMAECTIGEDTISISIA